jgi:hypothetical protein
LILLATSAVVIGAAAGGADPDRLGTLAAVGVVPLVIALILWNQAWFNSIMERILRR